MPIRSCRVVLVCGLLLAGFGSQHAAAQSKPVLVTVKAGELPIILSAPHGGGDAIPDVPERLGKGVKSFRSAADSGTAQLTEKLADALEKKLGKRPYVVIARFHRKYVDANRPSSGAYEAKQAKATYDAYHQALARARQEVIRRWGHGILFDIHGQGADPKAIFRGTQNGKTTTFLVDRFGREALIGKSSLFGQLAKEGLKVIPAVNSNDRETRGYSGGYIVQTYGSGGGGTLDAIQLELGKDLRVAKAAPATAARLANAIAAFAQQYLPKGKKDSNK